MNIVLVPFDFTKLTTEQQDAMFVAWCGQVMAEVKALGYTALLVFEDKGEVGMATEKVIQKADVWIDELPVNVLLAFGTMLDTDVPNQSRPEEKRNFPNVVAKQIVESAKELASYQAAGTLGEYVVTPRPATGDIEV